MMPTQTSPFEIISIEETEKLLDEDGTITYAGMLDATGLLPLLHNVYMEQLFAHSVEDYNVDLPDENAGIVVNANIIFSRFRELLQPYVGKGGKWDFLFTHEDGSSWSEEYVSSMVEELSQRTGIECTLEDLAYSFYRTEADSIFSQTQTKKKRQYIKEMMSGVESV